MCGRFTLSTNLADIQQAFNIQEVAFAPEPSYNIAPTQPVMAVIQHENRNRLDVMRWGLIPVWAKDIAIGSKMINARAETLAEKPSFKRLLKSRRCLIVADGFYEWQKLGARKTPMYIRLASHQPFAFAGLYDRWTSPDGEPITSCAIITTEPNALMQPIHNRMPVIVPQDQRSLWLDPANRHADGLLALLKPYPAEEMEAYAVSRLVNSPENNSPDCIVPASQ
ncbi:MAG: SOS response-associated peptidase [Chloroflexi bacterium]|nr:SOS response-associated peptidase [Chloroflexota bacterium]MBI3732889.1 SOS response-associated peptidase [Chloroflexota bacterium]